MKKEFNLVIYNNLEEFKSEPAVIKFEYEYTGKLKNIDMLLINELFGKEIGLEDLYEMPLYEIVDSKINDLKKIACVNNLTIKIEFDVYESKKDIDCYILNETDNMIEFGYASKEDKKIKSLDSLSLTNEESYNISEQFKTAGKINLNIEQIKNLSEIIDSKEFIREIDLKDIEMIIRYVMKKENSDDNNIFFKSFNDIKILIDLSDYENIDIKDIPLKKIIEKTMIKNQEGILFLNNNIESDKYLITENSFDMLNNIVNDLKKIILNNDVKKHKDKTRKVKLG